MALYRCGGGLSETTLWTNSSPTTSTSALDADLSASIQNFKYLKIYFRTSTTNSSESSVIYDVAQFTDFVSQGTSIPFFQGSLCVYTGSNSISVARRVRYSTNTQVSFLNATSVGTTGSSPTFAIPTKICGLN